MAARKRGAAGEALAGEGDDEQLASTKSKMKSMERKKLRRQLDKDRRVVDEDGSDGGKANSKPPVDASPAPPASDPVKEILPGSAPVLHMTHFRDLASPDATARVSAARSLIAELREVQRTYEGTDDEKVKSMEIDDDEGLDGLAEPLKYTLRRLVRGISSSREFARQGFALGLTAFLEAFPEVKVQPVMKLIVKLIEVTSGMRGQEARDNCFGRLFGFAALSRTGRVSAEWMLDNSSSIVKDFVGEVVRLAIKRRYFSELAASIILELAEKLPDKGLLAEVLEAPGIYSWFEKAAQDGDPDALFLALKLQERVTSDKEMFAKLLPSPFNPDKFFSREHLLAISSCFQESIFCLPRVHSLWPVVINILVPESAGHEMSGGRLNSGKKHKKSRKNNTFSDLDGNVSNFCEVVIEESLLLSSHDRKYLAYQVLLILLEKVPTSCIKFVLSSKTVHGLMDILANDSSWLHNTGQHFLKELIGFVGKDDDRRIATIISLQKYSSGNFDSITKTKTIKNLLSMSTSVDSSLSTVQSLVSVFIDEGSDTDYPSDQSQNTDENSDAGWAEDLPGQVTIMEPLKNWVIETIPQVLKNLKLSSERISGEINNEQHNPKDLRVTVSHKEKFRVQTEILKFLAVQGLFSATLGTEVTSFELQEKFKWPKVAISSSLHDECIKQLQLLLEAAQKEESYHGRNDNESSDLGSFFMHFIGTICNIPSVSLYRKLRNDEEKAFRKLLAMESTLVLKERRTNSREDASKMHAMRYLFIQLVLQILRSPGPFAEPAIELTIFCKKVFSISSVGDDPEEDIIDEDGAPEAMDVLVETLISLLPHVPATCLYAIEQVFRVFCDEVTETGVLDMLKVVRKELRPPRHRIADDSGEDDDDDDGDDLIGLEESDEGGLEATENGDLDSHTDEHEDEVEADDSDENVADANLEKENQSENDDSDGMDDDAMFRFDAYISQMLKERKVSGSDGAQSQLTSFKLRVLTLLEIYLQRISGSSSLVLTIYTALLKVYERCHLDDSGAQLKQRIGKIIDSRIFKAKEYPKGSDIELCNLQLLLGKALDSASRCRIQTISSLAEKSVFWILKIINSKRCSESELDRVFEMFRNLIEDYFNNKRSRLKHKFVKEVMRRHPWVGEQLLGFLLESCATAKSECRRVQILEVIDCIMKSFVRTSQGQQGDDDLRTSRPLEKHVNALCNLLQVLLGNLPEKHSRRTETRRFCKRVLNAISAVDLGKAFVAALKPETYNLCLSELGAAFRPFTSLNH